MLKWACCFIILISISSCKSSVSVDYELGRSPTSLNAVVTINDSSTKTTLEKKIPVLKSENNSNINNMEYAIVISKRGSLIFYMNKEFRYKLLNRFGDYYKISKSVSMVIKFMNPSDEIKQIKVSDSWVDGVPVSSMTFKKIYVKPNAYVTVEPSPVKMNEILKNGYGVFAILEDVE